jgi:hypothetical protein
MLRTPAVAAAALALALAAAAAAEKNDNWGAGALCAKCSGMGFTADIGTCAECKRGTSSGAFKLCQACGKKLGKCQACQGALPAPAEKKPDDPVKKDDGPRPAVEAWLKANVKGGGELPAPAEVGAAELRAVFPKHRFFTMLFRQFPVGRMVPEPLGSANLFAVSEADKEGKREVTHIKSAKELQDFYAKVLAHPKDEKELRAAAHGYCLLRSELAQDGFFKFEVDPSKFVVNIGDATDRVTARIAVAEGGGNSGGIDVTLTFQVGAAPEVSEKEQLKAGIRPICQSLKLTDPDPAVRAAAERDLLIMGRNALPYLREKIAGTGGELRERIRALARRIENGAGGPAVPGGQPPAE